MAEPLDAARRPVLFVSAQDTGQLNPLMVLAGELARRGVPDLLFATDEPRRTEIESLSGTSEMRFVSLGGVPPEWTATAWDDRTYRAMMRGSGFGALRGMVQHYIDPTVGPDKYRRLAAVVDEHRPALMVIDALSGFGIDVAITKGIPFVLSLTLMPSNMLSASTPFGKSYTPRDFPTPFSGQPYPMNPLQQVANRLFRLRTIAMFLDPRVITRMKAWLRARKELGISPRTLEPMARFEHAERVVCYTVAELDYPFPIPDKVALVGAMIPPLPQAADGRDVIDWLDRQSSVIYVCFGTITRLTRHEIHAIVEVARRLDGRHHVLWKVPAQQQRMLPPKTQLPANLRIESWLPSQLDVLAHPKVELFVNHAGGNAFHEGLYFGKPQVMRPLWLDCYDQAVRGEAAGIGLALDNPQGFDPDDVMDKVLRVLDNPSFTERAEHLAALQQAAGGRHKAADLLLDLMARVRTTTS